MVADMIISLSGLLVDFLLFTKVLSSAKHECSQNNSEQVYKLKNSSIKKKKKKKKKSKKKFKTEELRVITSGGFEAEGAILNKKLMKLEEYRSSEEVQRKNNVALSHLSSSSPKLLGTKHRFRPYETRKSPDVFKRPSLNSFSPYEARLQEKASRAQFVCNWTINGSVCGAGFNASEELNEHIKFHTTNELMTDLNFYYRTKALLGSQLNSPNASNLELNPFMGLYLSDINASSSPTSSNSKGLLMPSEYAKKSSNFYSQKH